MNATLATKLIFIASLVSASIKLRSHSSVIVTLSGREKSTYVPSEEINLSIRCDRFIALAEVPSSE